VTDRTVLVIDFEPTRLKATRELLLRAGFDVSSAANSNELARALQAPHPPVVLIEPMLPGHDGFAICRALKARSAGALPHVIIGARIFRGQRYKQMAKDAGADIFLHRPEHDQLLVDVLTQMIGATKQPIAVSSSAIASSADPLDLDFPRPVGATPDRGPLDDLDWDRFEQQLDNVFDGITTRQSEIPTGPAHAESPTTAIEAAATDPKLLVASATQTARDAHLTAAAPAEPAATSVRTVVSAPERGRSRAKLLIAAATLAVCGVAAALYLTRDWYTETPVPSSPQPNPAAPEVSPGTVAVEPGLEELGVPTGTPTTPTTPVLDLATPPARPGEAIEQRPPTSDPKPALKPRPSSERLIQPGPATKPSEAWPAPAVAAFTLPPAGATTNATTNAATSAATSATTTASPQPEPIMETVEPIEVEPDPKPETTTPTVQPHTSSADDSTNDATPDTWFEEFPAEGPMQAGVGQVTRPELIASTRIEPTYPSIAKQARKGGAVTMQAVVRADGTVGDVRVLREPDAGLGLGKAAVNAVKRWRFTPGTLKGKPIDTYLTVVVTFRP
jgi:protein TonB